MDTGIDSRLLVCNKLQVVQVLEGVSEVQDPPVVPCDRSGTHTKVPTTLSAATLGSWSYPSVR
jgi:hypothetical protein